MTSLYNQSVPVFTKYLHRMSGLVEKAKAHADEKSIAHDDILNYRMMSDMRGLIWQVQSCCNTVVWYVDRVGGLEHVAVEDNETTFDQLFQRIERTAAHLGKIDAKALDDKVATPIEIHIRAGDFRFDNAQTYLTEYAIPYFHFHLTSAYCILRSQGVPLGPLDYLTIVDHKM
ncbi:hypothetical protein BKA67DRAFT_520733 [Truncatella angustata]|uniref:DUF1993 domain-containing protein n=1 Tax=Truncatella angustata TaxID=152316 RepID=A0A9P8ZW04_9PEZI|nr:uncharacterized protein BKA67DRAFT_520733 [Truncatella angustata]KAH6652471.1 hypothetical protein BKA67DRAFT_520733 [Truncatella angustata]KAH8198349.1 hypothetical protein TruAng_007504 [Truncatella angustata]